MQRKHTRAPPPQKPEDLFLGYLYFLPRFAVFFAHGAVRPLDKLAAGAVFAEHRHHFVAIVHLRAKSKSKSEAESER